MGGELLSRDLLIQVSYFVTAALFILGLKRMSSPVTARSGILWAGAGMLVATVVTFAYPGMTNYPLIGAAVIAGKAIDDRFASQLKSQVDADVTLIQNGKVLASSLSGDETARLATEIERFRAGAEFIWGTKIPAAPVPTRVFAFDDRGVGRPFSYRSQRSYLLPSQRGDVIVLRTGGGWQGDTTRDLQLEYARRLFWNAAPESDRNVVSGARTVTPSSPIIMPVTNRYS